MTHKRQRLEQIASHMNNRNESASEGAMSKQREARGAVRTLPRVVTTPKSDLSTAWNTFAQRQELLRRARAKPQKYMKMASRTYAQTGSKAASGRTRPPRRQLPPHRTTIPKRSGRLVTRKGLLWRLLSIFLGVLVLILTVSFVFSSSNFRVEQVNIVGTHNGALIHTIQKMGVQGQNIFLLNAALLTERIDGLPVVESVDVSKQLPNRLMITVVERVPVLLWQTPEGIYSVDRYGIVIGPAKQVMGNEHLNVVVTGLNDNVKGNQQSDKAATHTRVQLVRPGMRLNQQDITFVLDVFTNLPRITGVDTFKLHYDGTMYPDTTNGHGVQSRKGSYSVESQDGWIAYLGGADDANSLENKLIELQQILSLAKNQHLNLATIDLRYGLYPVYTLKS